MVMGAKLAWLMVIAVALVAHLGDSEEIQTLDEQADSLDQYTRQFGGMDEYMEDGATMAEATHKLLSQADRLIRAHNNLIELGEGAEPSQNIADKIKQIQTEISHIRSKRSKLQQESAKAKENSQTASEAERDAHLKVHITAGAKDQDLSVAEDEKNKQLAHLTNGADPDADAASSSWSSEQFDKQWQAMREKLHAMLGELHTHVDAIKGIARKHFDALRKHAEDLQKQAAAEREKRRAAEEATKEKVEKAKVIQSKEGVAKTAEKEAKGEYKKFQESVAERKQKAVEAERKNTKHEQEQKEANERQMKLLENKLASLKGKLSGDGSLKAEIERLKADIRKHNESYERTTKAHEKEVQKQQARADEKYMRVKAEADKETARADTVEKQMADAKEVAKKAFQQEKSRADKAERKVQTAESEVATQKRKLASAKHALTAVKSKMEQLTTAYEQKLSVKTREIQTQADLKRDAVSKVRDSERVIARMKREEKQMRSKILAETAARNKAQTLARKYRREADLEKRNLKTVKKDLETKLETTKSDLEGKLKDATEQNHKLTADLEETKTKLHEAETARDQCKGDLRTCTSNLKKIQKGMQSVSKIADVHDVGKETYEDDFSVSDKPTGTEHAGAKNI
jgi:hypothetical protein